MESDPHSRPGPMHPNKYRSSSSCSLKVQAPVDAREALRLRGKPELPTFALRICAARQSSHAPGGSQVEQEKRTHPPDVTVDRRSPALRILNTIIVSCVSRLYVTLRALCPRKIGLGEARQHTFDMPQFRFLVCWSCGKRFQSFGISCNIESP